MGSTSEDETLDSDTEDEEADTIAVTTNNRGLTESSANDGLNRTIEALDLKDSTTATLKKRYESFDDLLMQNIYEEYFKDYQIVNLLSTKIENQCLIQESNYLRLMNNGYAACLLVENAL